VRGLVTSSDVIASYSPHFSVIGFSHTKSSFLNSRIMTAINPAASVLAREVIAKGFLILCAQSPAASKV
jgi:hypothetical protein